MNASLGLLGGGWLSNKLGKAPHPYLWPEGSGFFAHLYDPSQVPVLSVQAHVFFSAVWLNFLQEALLTLPQGSQLPVLFIHTSSVCPSSPAHPRNMSPLRAEMGVDLWLWVMDIPADVSQLEEFADSRATRMSWK